MKRFATDVEMQKSGFWAFSNMSKNDENDNSEDMVNDVIDVRLNHYIKYVGGCGVVHTRYAYA